MSLIAGRFEKKAADGYDYEFDFTPWLLDRKDSIASFTVQASLPAGLTITGAAMNNGIVKFYAEGGVLNVTYTVHCDIVTVGNGVQRKKRGTMTIKVLA